MKKLFILLFSLNTITTYSQNCGDFQNLNGAQSTLINQILPLLDSALKQENLFQIDSLSAELKDAFGSEGGIPEAIELYDTLHTNTNWLSLNNALTLSRILIDNDSLVYVDLWKFSKGMMPPAYLPNSVFLRASAEIAAGLHQIAYFETNITRKNLYTTWANRAMDSLATMQLPNGAFPFPDLRDYGDATFSSIIQNFLNFCGPDSVNVLQNGWIIDDKNTGEFKFDAGVIANAYYKSYLYTGNTNYKNIAVAIADYLMPLKFNVNYNYNTFVTLGLTRGYQLTNDINYLERSIKNVRFGAEPGQLPNGRWVDGHNANSRYHSIIIQNTSSLTNEIGTAHIYQNSIDTMFLNSVRNMLKYVENCKAATGYRWLIQAYQVENSILPSSLVDSMTNLIGRYVQMSGYDGSFLDIPTMGEYFELLNSINSIKETETNNSLFLYPNPTSDLLNISLEELKNENTLNIYDLQGKIVYSSSINEKNIILSTAFLKEGMYLIEIIGDSYSQRKLFIKN